MSDINCGEIERLYQWACDYHTKEIEEKYFTRIDKNCKSYFEKKKPQEEYCIEYKFQTMPDLRAELKKLWKDDDTMKQIEKVVLVASMKNKPANENEKEDIGKENIEQMKPYIYNF